MSHTPRSRLASRSRLLRYVLAISLCASITPALLAAAPAGAEPGDDPSFTKVSEAIPSAQVALRRAKAVAAGRGRTQDITLTLRDLAARIGELEGVDRKVAKAILARPNGGHTRIDSSIGATWPGQEAPASPECHPPICVHWTASGRHRPPLEDVSPANGVPDQVDRTLTVMEHVWDRIIGDFGYRPPLTDQRASIDADSNFDVYLSDIGANRYYGYCPIDDSRNNSGYRFFDRSGYCVVDDDFARSQFPIHSPLQNLQVTAAHEFFHAIQFGYDAFDDTWFMEATAAWIEDEVYDGVNDNWQYLANSPLRQPDKPLDRSSGIAIYGSWIYFKYLSERFDRDIVRQAWRRADGSKGAPNDYSLLGIRRALNGRGADFGSVMAGFAAANRNPRLSYSEGSHYPVAHLPSKELTASNPSTGWINRRLDHAASSSIAVRPTRNTPAGARVNVAVDGPKRATMPQARVLVEHRNGSVDSKTIKLNRSGNGAVSVDFARARVRDVTVVLVNGSDRFRRCYRFLTQYSCRGGTPVDDNKLYWAKIALR